jgi:ribulose-phosphate 3-epimerase
MVEVIPAILVKDYSSLRKEIKKVEPYIDWVQLDIIDGLFAPNRTWYNPEELLAEEFLVKIEVHLMVKNPLEKIDSWIEGGVKRIIVHIESIDERGIRELIKKCSLAGIEVGLALKPKTPLLEVQKFIKVVDLILTLGVEPGFSGQKFQDRVLAKIKILKENYPLVKIEVDGGINLETGKKAVQAGADILVSRSYIFSFKKPKEGIERLRKVEE